MHVHGRRLIPLLLAASVAACEGRPDPAASLHASSLAVDSDLEARRIGADPTTALDLVLVAQRGVPETDSRPIFDLVRVDPVRGTRALVATEILDAVVAPPWVYLLHADHRLTRQAASSPTLCCGYGPSLAFGSLRASLARGSRELIFEEAFEAPAVLPSGEIVVARRSQDPGETDLWIVGDGGARPLAPAPGPDHSPLALPDGRVAFVSARTTVASIWIADPRTGEAEQLTNRGLAAGIAKGGFIPTPVERLDLAGETLSYDAGGGERWLVDLSTGDARRAEVVQ